MHAITRRPSQNEAFARGLEALSRPYHQSPHTANDSSWDKIAAASDAGSSGAGQTSIQRLSERQDDELQLQTMPTTDKYEPNEAQSPSQRQSVAHVVSVYDRRYQHLSDLRFQDSSKRTEVHYQWDSFHYDLEHLQSSTKAIMETALASKPELSPKKQKTQFRKLSTIMQSQHERLVEKMKHVDELMADLRGKDTRLEKAELALDTAYRAMLAALDVDSLADDADNMFGVPRVPTSTAPSEVSLDTAPPMAPQLMGFYDAVSNYKIMRERVIELEAEQQEQEERRGLQADQDQVLDQTDEEFNATWQHSLVSPKKDLEDARVVLRHSRGTCIEANLTMPTLAEVEISEDEIGELRSGSVHVQEVSSPTSIPAYRPTEGAQTTLLEHDKYVPSGEAGYVQESPTTAFDQALLPSNGSSSPSPLAVNLVATERVISWIDTVKSTNCKATEETFSTHALDRCKSAPDLSLRHHQRNTTIRAVKSFDDLTSLQSFYLDSNTPISFTRTSGVDIGTIDTQFTSLNGSLPPKQQPP